MPAVLERASDIGTADCLCFNGAGDNGVLAVQPEQRQMHRCRLCADFGNDGCRGCVDGSVVPITAIVVILSFTVAPLPTATLMAFLIGAALLLIR